MDSVHHYCGAMNQPLWKKNVNGFTISNRTVIKTVTLTWYRQWHWIDTDSDTDLIQTVTLTWYRQWHWIDTDSDTDLKQTVTLTWNRQWHWLDTDSDTDLIQTVTLTWYRLTKNKPHYYLTAQSTTMTHHVDCLKIYSHKIFRKR
jgi:hypothetical protein